MDDLVQHIVRELSFEGDLGEPLVLHLIGDCPALRDLSPSCASRGGSTLVVALFIFTI